MSTSEEETTPITYKLPLVAVDETSTIFMHSFLEGKHPVALELPKETWIDMGRPGHLFITPTQSLPER